MLDVRSIEAKIGVFEFDYEKINMLMSVQCSKNVVRVLSMFNKILFDP